MNDYYVRYMKYGVLGMIGVLFILFQFVGCQTTNDKIQSFNFQLPEKQKGMHVFGLRGAPDYTFLEEYNLNWITIVPWGYQPDYNSPVVNHDRRGGASERKRRDSMWVDNILNLKSQGYMVFLKPHIWIHEPSKNKWRSDIFPDNDEDWESWSSTYREFIIRYAKVAEEAGAEMYCVGMELTRLSVEKPDYWRSLIADVREVYNGKLTYAANWYKEYDLVEFWDDLDYIGVQAYFPLTKKDSPSIEDVSKGWKKYIPELESLARNYQKPLLFTEIGYKSMEGTAEKPWVWVEQTERNSSSYAPELQAYCYEAFFKMLWHKEWFAGAHIWQLRGDYGRRRPFRENDLDFTPHKKPAKEVIAKWYSSSAE